nr:unnamed protein product [Digitaria exilis]
MARTNKEWWPASFMVLIQVFITGQILLTKVVVDDGLSVCILLTYRFFMGAILVTPVAVIFEKGKLKELNLKAFIWIFTSALVGFTIPGLYYIGLGDTSPGYAINFYNIIPIATFILAVIFSLYKGKVLHLWPTNIIGYHSKHSGAAYGHHHMRGTILLIISCLSLAVWYTVQAQMLKVFPYKYWSTVATCFVGCIQMAVVGVAMNREKTTWQLKWNMSLLTIVYSAILNTAAKFVMISWVVTQRGPTYPSMFCAVSVLFTTVLDSLLLGHDLSIGSILGMLMILAGLYLFLWGKRKELVPESERKLQDELPSEDKIIGSGSNV